MPLVQTRSLAGSRNLMRAALSCKMCEGSYFLELSLSPGGIFCWPLQRVRDVCIIPRLNCHLFDTTKNTILCMKSRGGCPFMRDRPVLVLTSIACSFLALAAGLSVDIPEDYLRVASSFHVPVNSRQPPNERARKGKGLATSVNWPSAPFGLFSCNGDSPHTRLLGSPFWELTAL